MLASQPACCRTSVGRCQDIRSPPPPLFSPLNPPAHTPYVFQNPEYRLIPAAKAFGGYVGWVTLVDMLMEPVRNEEAGTIGRVLERWFYFGLCAARVSGRPGRGAVWGRVEGDAMQAFKVCTVFHNQGFRSWFRDRQGRHMLTKDLEFGDLTLGSREQASWTNVH